MDIRIQNQNPQPETGGLTAAYDQLQAHSHIDGEGIELAMEFDYLATEAGADPDWSRERLARFEAGRKGGLTTLARYGKPYFRALARARWGKTPKGALPAIRDVLRKGSHEVGGNSQAPPGMGPETKTETKTETGERIAA